MRKIKKNPVMTELSRQRFEPGTSCHIVRWIVTNISEEPAASIFRAEE
jgi:hypothetical protein